MSEFEVAGVQYQARKLDALTQAKILRRIAPVIGPLTTTVASQEGEQLRATLQQAALEVLGKLTDDDVEYVVKACLRVCSRQSGQGWAPLTTPDGTLMFQDINDDLFATFQIVANVIQGTYVRFTSAVRSSESGRRPRPRASSSP